MKQFSLTTIPLLCAAIAPLCADNMDNMISQSNNGNGNNGSNSTQMSNQKKKTESQKQFEQRWRDNQITPMAKPRPDGDLNLFVTADFIYWKAYEEGLAYAYDGVPNAPTAVPPSASTGKVFRPKFKWEPGFKVGIGNKFSHDGWDLYAQYTWLRSDAKDDEDETECCVTQTVIAKSNYWLSTNACPEGVLMGAEGAKWNLDNFNVVDLELGRDYYISKFLTLRPFGGLKFAWMKQKYKVDYDDILYVGDEGDAFEDPLSVIPIGSDVDLKFHQKEFGVGLRAGLDTQWYFCKWLGAYGDFALTGLWNHFKEKRTVEVSTPAGTTYDSESIKDKVYDVTAVLEVGLGLFFEWAFCNDDYMFQLEAGWETQVWFNQNNMIFLMDNNAPGNLSFQGFTLKAGFGF
jgi:hypothetical protein